MSLQTRKLNERSDAARSADRDWSGAMTIAQMIDMQGGIIRLQSQIIDELAATLLQHIDADDMPCLKEIKLAADTIEGLEKCTRL